MKFPSIIPKDRKYQVLALVAAIMVCGVSAVAAARSTQQPMVMGLGGGVFVAALGYVIYLVYEMAKKKHATGEDACKNKKGKACSDLNRGCPTDTKSDEDGCGKCLKGHTQDAKTNECKKIPTAATDKDKNKTKNKGK